MGLRCYNCGRDYPEELMKARAERVEGHLRKVPFCRECFSRFFRSPNFLIRFVFVIVVNVALFARVWAGGYRGAFWFGIGVFIVAAAVLMWRIQAVRLGPYYTSYHPHRRW